MAYISVYNWCSTPCQSFHIFVFICFNVYNAGSKIVLFAHKYENDIAGMCINFLLFLEEENESVDICTNLVVSL